MKQGPSLTTAGGPYSVQDPIEISDGVDTRVRIQLDATGRFVCVRVQGVPGPQFAQRIHETTARAFPGIGRLLDLRRADLSTWNADAIRSFFASVSKRASGRDRLRVALLTEGDLTYGIARMFEGLTPAELLIEYRAFRTEERAVAWLTESPDPAA